MREAHKEITEEQKTAARDAVEKPMSREQKRKSERISEEAKKTYEAICDRFFEFFTQADDPNGHDVTNKASTVSKQWRLYCQRKGLLPKAYPLVDNFTRDLIDKYNNPEVIEPSEDQKNQSLDERDS